MTPEDPTHRHAGHDELLVAAYAAGDLSGEQQAKAEALVASCADCRALVADLRSLVAALRSLPSPARPRDFRITERQAAALRQRGLGRFVAGRRSWTGFARPRGTALATFGVAGLLLTASIGGLGLPGTAASAPAIGADYGA
ncbi:MAG TPA: hypothetical protein VEY67_02990, partial [Candidatus Dormibacteraeota bacterium]|nr:hypothetical protein [Candidatus Dormibacteraeota bacterium]